MDEITLYEWLLFAHIAAVVAWVGANTVLQVLTLRTRAAGPDRMVQFTADIAWLGTHYFIPISLAVVGLGFALVAESDGAYDLGQFWVAAGIAMFVVSFALGAGFLGPETERISEMAEKRGPEDEEVQRRITRVIWVARFELLLLFLVIFDMVVKPGL